MRIHHLITTTSLIAILFMSRSIGMSQTNRDSKVSASIFLLSSDDSKARFNAGQTLDQLGTNAAPAVPAIIQLLETHPEKVHDIMLRVLENCPKEAQAAKPALEKHLQSSNHNIRISCARTLWVLDHSYANQVRPIARNSLKDSDAGNRIEGASLLWRLDHDATAVVPTLISLLSDADQSYDYRTIKFLGNIGPPAKEAVPAIQDWMKSGRMHDAFVTNAAIAALQSIKGKP